MITSLILRFRLLLKGLEDQTRNRNRAAIKREVLPFCGTTYAIPQVDKKVQVLLLLLNWYESYLWLEKGEMSYIVSSSFAYYTCCSVLLLTTWLRFTDTFTDSFS